MGRETALRSGREEKRIVGSLNTKSGTFGGDARCLRTGSGSPRTAISDSPERRERDPGG